MAPPKVQREDPCPLSLSVGGLASCQVQSGAAEAGMAHGTVDGIRLPVPPCG